MSNPILSAIAQVFVLKQMHTLKLYADKILHRASMCNWLKGNNGAQYGELHIRSVIEIKINNRLNYYREYTEHYLNIYIRYIYNIKKDFDGIISRWRFFFLFFYLYWFLTFNSFLPFSSIQSFQLYFSKLYNILLRCRKREIIYIWDEMIWKTLKELNCIKSIFNCIFYGWESWEKQIVNRISFII